MSVSSDTNHKGLLIATTGVALGASVATAILTGGAAPAGWQPLLKLGLTQGVGILGQLSTEVGGSLLTNLLTSSAGHQGLQRYRSLEVAGGKAIATILQSATTHLNDSRQRKVLRFLAAHAVDEWLSLPVKPVTEADLVTLFDRSSSSPWVPLTPEEWEELIRTLSRRSTARLPYLKRTKYRLHTTTIQYAGKTLYETFATTLRDVILADVEAGGSSFAGLTLSLLSEILKSTRESSGNWADAKIRDVLASVVGELTAVERAEHAAVIAQLSAVDMRLTDMAAAQKDQTEKLDVLIHLSTHTARAITTETSLAPRAIFTVPRGAGREVIGRDTELARLTAYLQNDGVCAITGLPGVGKSTLAIRYAHEARSIYPDGVFWIVVGQEGSSNDVRLNAAGIVIDIAHQSQQKTTAPLDLVGVRSEIARLLGNRRSLLVLDNVIDDSFTYCIPPAPCHTIVTARKRDLIADAGWPSVDLEGLSPEDSQRLLRRRLERVGAAEVTPLTEGSHSLHGGLPLYIVLLARSFARGEPLTTKLPQSLHEGLNSLWETLDSQRQKLLLPLGIGPLPRADVEMVATVSGTAKDRTQRYLDELVYAGLVQRLSSRSYSLHPVLKHFITDLITRRGNLIELTERYSLYYRDWCERSWHDVGLVQEELRDILHAFRCLREDAHRWPCQIAMYVWALEVSGFDSPLNEEDRTGSSVRLLQQLVPESFPESNHIGGRSSRGAVVHEIMNSGITRSAGSLNANRRHLASDDEYVRWAACWAIGQLGSPEATTELRHASMTDTSWFVRWAAVEALAKAPGSEIDDHLLHLLERTDLRLRGAALDAIGVRKARHLLPWIERLLNSDVPVLRARAVAATARLNASENWEWTVRLLQDPDMWVRSVANRALTWRVD